MKKNVLLVEDARDIQLLVSTTLGDRVNLTCVETAEEANKELHSREYALVLLDVMLPDANGFEFCRRLREEDVFSDLSICFLTGADETASKINGFNSGGDDYLTKPFDPRELEARVMRKLEKAAPGGKNVIVLDGFRLDLVQHKIFQRTKQGDEVLLPLTPLEFRLLSLFLRNEGKIFPRQELLRLFWGDAVSVSRNTVDTHISSLRKKMGRDGAALKSFFKKGYCFTRKAADHLKGAVTETEASGRSKAPPSF